jgi:lysozyme family protein
VKLLLWLKGNQPDVFQFEFVLGHDEVSPGRKNDPGGALSVTLPQFRERLVSMHGGKEAAPIVAEDPMPRALASTRLEFAPTRFFPEALAFQKAVNLFPGIKLTEDGYPGENTSAALQLLTGFYLKGDPRASDTPLLPIHPRPVPVEAPEGSRRIKIGRQIVDWEARRDRQGRLTVYQLPGNDGGGNYEVAGINQRYHPQAARQLAELIESGNDQQAESVAAEYIASYTDAVARLVSNAGLEAFLRDSTFNRGLGGATKILQLALKVSVTGVIGQESRAALAKLEKVKPVELLKDLRAARETYERYYIGYRANFWQGLVNRWNKAHTFALSLLRSEEARSAAIEASLAQSREASVTMSPGGSNPVAEPLSPSLPPLCFDPSRDSIVTKRFQEFANSIAQLRLEEDGLAGEKTSDAFQRIFGYRLAGDPR